MIYARDVNSTVIIGAEPSGAPVEIDVEELLASRLLVQGNSGSGKSHLLRRLLEESAPLVQQIVIDPEGDFVTLAEPFGHIVVDGAAYASDEITRLATRIRKHRASAVLALDGLEVEAQMRCAAQFLSALFEAPRDEWYPALVVVDEAQMFAPAAAGDVNDEVRRMSLAAMTNLMCRGRKRGLAGVIATQRLAKLAKNVAAEASNFLMGRTFLDIDMARAADLLGMERRQAELIRDLERGQFLGLGPAIARRPVSIRIGAVRTDSRAVSHALAPPPDASREEWRNLIHAAPSVAEVTRDPPASSNPGGPLDANALLEQIASFENPSDGQTGSVTAAQPAVDSRAVLAEIFAEMAKEPDCTFQSAATLYQDFSVRCRMRRLSGQQLDLIQFRRRFSMALAGIDPDQEEWADVARVSESVADDLLAPFLLLARAAHKNASCPDDDELARIYGTRSPGRIRRLLEHLEKNELIVVRTDFAGRRSVAIPMLGVATAA